MSRRESKNFFLRVKALYANLLDVSLAIFILPTLTFMGLNSTQTVFYWWLVFMLCSTGLLFKSWMIKRNLSESTPHRKLKEYLNQWCYQTYFSSIMWAALPWCILNPDPKSTLLFAFVIAGVTAGATIACAAFPKISFVYSFIILSSLVSNLVYQGGRENIILAAEAFLYLILLIKMQNSLFAFLMKTFSTMTDLDYANEQIKKSQLMAVETSRLAAQAEMTASLAHEINNPLAIIYLKTEHLLKCLDKGVMTDDLVRSFCDKNLLMVDRMQQIILATKQYFYQNHVEEENKITSLDEALKEIIDIFSKKCQNWGVQFESNVKAPHIVIGVRTTILQVLTNLLNNAFDEVKNQKNGKISIYLEKTKDDVTVCVTDSGPGIADDSLEKIFEPFYTTKGKGAGLGMGLSICVGLVKQIGGRLWVEPGSPTTFKFKLKLAAESISEQLV